MATSSFTELYRAAASSGRLQDPPSVFLVLLVNGTEGCSVRPILEKERYRILSVSSWADATAIMGSERVDLIIGYWDELSGPEGLSWCRSIKTQRRTELIPIMVVSPASKVRHHIAALEAGADDLLCEPLNERLFRARVKALLRHKSALDRLEQTEGILFALAQTVEKRDSKTGGHCERLALLSLAMGMSMSLPLRDLLALERGGYLHDVGKLAIPDWILFKKGPLSEEEWSTMRTHPVIGEDICRPLKSLAPVLPIIRGHHERCDGTGYPDGLKHEQIPVLARVLQTADIYDALISSRPYKSALPGWKALQIMWEETERGWRDRELMTLFTDLHNRGIVDMVYRHGLEHSTREGEPRSLLNMHRSLLEDAVLSERQNGHSNLYSRIP
jgi:putative two-component system response regulator